MENFLAWEVLVIHITGADPDFLKGGSTLELQLQPSCRLKTNKNGHHLLTIATSHHTCPHQLYFLIYNYIHSLIATLLLLRIL